MRRLKIRPDRHSGEQRRPQFLRGLLDLREDGWDKCFNTNVKAVWLLSRLVARKMMEQKRKIINITTVGAEKAEVGMAAYGCSKAALKHRPAAWRGSGRSSASM